MAEETLQIGKAREAIKKRTTTVVKLWQEDSHICVSIISGGLVMSRTLESALGSFHFTLSLSKPSFLSLPFPLSPFPSPISSFSATFLPCCLCLSRGWVRQNPALKSAFSFKYFSAYYQESVAPSSMHLDSPHFIWLFLSVRTPAHKRSINSLLV